MIQISEAQISVLPSITGRSTVAKVRQEHQQRMGALYDSITHELTTAWRCDAGNERVVPDAPKAAGNDVMPVDDIETAYWRRNFTGVEDAGISGTLRKRSSHSAHLFDLRSLGGSAPGPLRLRSLP